jgi:hypothetical protein
MLSITVPMYFFFALSGQLHPFAFRQLRRQLAAALPTVSLPAIDSSFTTEATSRP